MSYHFTSYPCEDHPIIRAGDIVSCLYIDGAAFGHAVVLGFDALGDKAVALLGRPYARASGVGTTSPNAMLGCETYSLPAAHLLGKVIATGHRD